MQRNVSDMDMNPSPPNNLDPNPGSFCMYVLQYLILHFVSYWIRLCTTFSLLDEEFFQYISVKLNKYKT